MEVLDGVELNYSTDGGVESDSAAVRPLLEANGFRPVIRNNGRISPKVLQLFATTPPDIAITVYSV
jgi:hypothetical protein